jgi:choline dehydrogenase
MLRLAALAQRIFPGFKSSTTIPKFKEYDFIIVGGGSAGCLLANELSASGKHSILLIEAGGWDWNPLIHIPAGVYSVFKDPSINWNYFSEPEPFANNRNIELPRGKVVGGSSAINAMVYMRGHPKDYDRWCEEFNLPNWKFSSVFPYFLKCETSDRGSDSIYRGNKGRLKVTQGNMKNPLFDALLEAGDSSGQGTSTDLNGYKPEGIARLDRTASPDGRRCSSADAHLMPALKRANCELTTNCIVDKINLNGQLCSTGVTLSTGEIIKARNEVILSCGAIKSPQLLMLSGIGPKKHLNEIGIDCKHHLPGVGQNLQDHPCVVTGYHSTKETEKHSLSYLSKPFQKIFTGLRWFFNGTGAASSNIWEGGGLVYGDTYKVAKDTNTKLLNAPNLQYHFCPVLSEYDGEELTLKPGFQMQIDQLRPFSRGNIKLRSSNPKDPPRVTFNYFSDNRDIEEMRDGLIKATELLHEPSFDLYRGKRSMPSSFDPRSCTNEELDNWIRNNSGTDYHPCGTCRMGGVLTDVNAVVDNELKVIGVQNLRVVDASIMPNIVSGNLNAPVQMIAMKAADIILGNKQLEILEKDMPKYHSDDSHLE